MTQEQIALNQAAKKKIADIFRSFDQSQRLYDLSVGIFKELHGNCVMLPFLMKDMCDETGLDYQFPQETVCAIMLNMKSEIEELRKKCDFTTDETPIK